MRQDNKIYDDASRHYKGDWPEGLPHFQAYVHTGIYLGWIVKAKLYGDGFRKENAEHITAFEAKRISGPELFQRIGGVFSSDMLNDAGDAFTAEYFDLEQGTYLKDYGHMLANIQITAYHVPDTEESFRRMSVRIQQRYELWEKSRGK